MRKTLDLTIQADGRDRAKVFKLTEMPAVQAEKWATRALQAIGKSNPELPEEWQGMGMTGMAVIGLKMLAGVPWHEGEALLDEMLTCVQVYGTPGTESTLRRFMPEVDVEEVATLLQLRSEVFALHTGFSPAAELSKLRAASAAKVQATDDPTPTTSTFQDQSQPSSPPDTPVS